MTDDSLFLIDVDKILRTKAPKQYKYIPKFVVSYLKKIVHQDEINVFLNESKDKLGVDFLEACMEFLDAKVEVKGIENLPKEGLYTFVSNHPLGGQDGVALGYVLGRHYDGKVKYLVNDLLMNLRGLAPLCVPINKTGKQAKDFPKMVEAGFQSDDQMIMFPAGLCSRRQNGVIRDLEWKKTFIIKSIQAKRDVVPVHFGGRNSDFFYNLANVCKALGIKFNIAMLYLADEMFKNRHKTFTVISKEYSMEWQEGMEPYYPVNDLKNNHLYDQYKKLAEKEKDIIFGGRLAEYKYYDMAPIIEKVLKLEL